MLLSAGFVCLVIKLLFFAVYLFSHCVAWQLTVKLAAVAVCCTTVPSVRNVSLRELRMPDAVCSHNSTEGHPEGPH